MPDLTRSLATQKGLNRVINLNRLEISRLSSNMWGRIKANKKRGISQGKDRIARKSLKSYRRSTKQMIMMIF